MKADDIRRGRFYRLWGSNTILMTISEWAASEHHPRELEYAAIHGSGVQGGATKRETAEQLAVRCSCEVMPQWVDVTPAKVVAPDPRQTEIVESEPSPFLAGLLSG